jgi:hypothetical protein
VNALHAGLGIAMVAVNLGAGAFGAGAWALARSGHSRLFWLLLRAGQALAVLVAADGLILVIAGRDLPELHLVYGLTPLGVSFLAEQLRLASADSVLQARGLEDAEGMRELPESDQRGIVRAILRREMGVMAISAVVVGVLGMRAGEWL